MDHENTCVYAVESFIAATYLSVLASHGAVRKATHVYVTASYKTR